MRKANPGRMNSRVSPRKTACPVSPSADDACWSASRARCSSTRIEVVPTAMMRRPAWRASQRRVHVVASTSYASACKVAALNVCARSGWKVPSPTCRVRLSTVTPADASAASRPVVKCSPAVGAAAEPVLQAYVVW